MATIISEEHRLAFIHIPKCAGMSASLALRDEISHDPRFLGAIPDANGRRQYLEIPGLGIVNGPHLSLPIYAAFLPDVLEKIASYRSYAIIRDPQKRFRSAVSQYFSEFKGMPLAAASEAQIKQELDVIMSGLQRNPAAPGLPLMHFIRQVDFIYLEGRPYVDRLYPMDSLAALAADLSDYLGRPLPMEMTNASLAISGTFGRSVLSKGAHLGRKFLKPKTFRKLRGVAAGLLRRRSSGPLPGPLSSDVVQDFVQDFYASDGRLFGLCAGQAGAAPPSPASVFTPVPARPLAAAQEVAEPRLHGSWDQLASPTASQL